MIVSKQAAEDRLASGRNRLRDRDVPVSSSSSTPIEVEDDQRPADSELSDSSPAPKKQSLQLDLSSLDKLIDPKASYRLKTDQQVGIAEAAIIVGRRDTSAIFGLSRTQVGAYENGEQSSATQAGRPNTNPTLKRRIEEAKEQIAELAVGRLSAALTLITDDKLTGIKKATNLVRVGKDLAVILDKVTPHTDDSDSKHIHFHVYRPPVLAEKDYQTVKVGVASEVFIDAVKA